MNILNGGKHAQNSTDFQEFMVAPAGASSFAEALRWGSEVYASLKKVLSNRGLNTNVGDEGGFAPSLSANREAVEVILQAIEAAGFRPGEDVFIALDPAMSELYQNGKYVLEREGRSLDSAEMVDFWADWCSRYPIISIEDGLAEDDWTGWKLLTDRLGKTIQLVGDDLFVTQVDRVRRGIAEGVSNSVLIKVNQVGTLTETFDADDDRVPRWLDERRLPPVRGDRRRDDLAHRGGDEPGQIKTRAPARASEVAKYNRAYCPIEEHLGSAARWPGPGAYPSLRKTG